MRERQYQLFLVLALVFTVSACSHGFRLTTIPAEEIPIAIRENAEPWSGTKTNLVWRAYYEQDGYLIAVNTHNWTRDSEPRRLVEWHRIHSDTGWSTGRTVSWGTELYSMGSGRVGVFSINAHGWAFNKAAHRVIGTTNLGRSTEGLVVGGFWFVTIDLVHPDETFEAMVVEDDQGNVLHTY